MLLTEVVATSGTVAATASRTAKTNAVADLLRSAEPEDAELAVALLAGAPRQRRTGVGRAGLRDLPGPAATPGVTLRDLDETLTALETTSGAGSLARRQELLAGLFGASTEAEQRFLRALLTGELRQGALEAVVTDAVARAAGLPLADVRRAVMLHGDPPAVARLALTGDQRERADAVAAVGLRVGRAVQPMLAGSAKTVADAITKTGPAGIDTKLDGVRVQVHRAGQTVRVFSRSLDELTARMPEVVAAALALPCSAAVLDGEALALDAQGRPRAFQDTASRAARGAGGDLSVAFFDLLHLDGRDLLNAPAHERWAALERLVPPAQRVTRVVTADPADAEAALQAALAQGHEGVVVKGVDTTYEAGRRGAGWIKVKPVHTFDLVVLAAEWGHGRRTGWLSNLHLGCRATGSTDSFVMLGKTFKGLTDELLRAQTEQLLALADGPTDGYTVRVRPELVVEIALDGLQRSTRYPGGVAMRFARVLRYRPDKTAAEADDLATVLALNTTSDVHLPDGSAGSGSVEPGGHAPDPS